jgi:plastocyanin
MFMLAQLVLAAPVGAAAESVTITADMQSAVPTGRLWSFNDFFPRTVSIPTGSDITFMNQGFHTFTVLPAGTSARSDQHGNGLALADTDDTGKNPNGTTHAELNLAALGPTSFTCGSPAAPCGFDGLSVVSSGVPAGPPAPFVVHVTAAPGTYVFVCRVHAGMNGRIHVLPATAHGHSPAYIQKQIARQIKQDLKGAWIADRRANQHAKVRNHDGTRTWRVTAGTSSADGRVALVEFLPRNIRIERGDKVIFRPRSPNEPHTVTFPGDLGTEFVPFCEAGTIDIPLGPVVTSCNGGPPDELELDGGNGVRRVTTPTTVSDSGIIGPRRLASDIGLPRTAILNTWTVSFRRAAHGTYTYVCQIHDGMAGTIVVH